MSKFKQYTRTSIIEMRPVTNADTFASLRKERVYISSADAKTGSPKVGDQIIRNSENHDDKWLVAEKYFNKNFIEVFPYNTWEIDDIVWVRDSSEEAWIKGHYAGLNINDDPCMFDDQKTSKETNYKSSWEYATKIDPNN